MEPEKELTLMTIKRDKMTYIEEIKKAMKLLADDKRTILLGQSVKYSGTGLYWTLEGTFPQERRIELPVFEDIQLGMSLGMSLEGFIPVSIYPRIDFLLLAMSQLVLHLDKMESMSDGQFKPKVIIRTAIGSVKPLFPGEQHNGDYTDAIRSMLKHIDLIKLEKKEDILPAYKKALESERSTILVEIPDNYNS